MVRSLSIASRVLLAAGVLSLSVSSSVAALTYAGVSAHVGGPTHAPLARLTESVGLGLAKALPDGPMRMKANESTSEDPFLGVEVSDLLEDASLLHPDVVASVQVDLNRLGPVAGQLLDAYQSRADAERRSEQSRVERHRLSVLIAALRGDLEEAQSELVVAKSEEAKSERALVDIAISTFMTLEGSNLDGSGPGVAASSFEAIASNSQSQLDNQFEGATGRRVVAENVLEVVSLGLAVAGEDRDQQDFFGVQARRDHVLAQTEIDLLQRNFERSLMTAEIVGTEIPVVVFDAYYRAALKVEIEQPRCEVVWSQLAGIGKVESSHGSFGGNAVGVDGRTSGEILGPVLDGLVFSEILDTDGGLLDGDEEFDRAVGPMQFIPGSWKIYGRDGNGDGVADPHNMYDAALAAALHLCGSNSGMADESNFTNALLGYNQSVSYGVLVKAFVRDYEDAVGPIVVVQQEPDLLDVVDVPVRIF